MFYMLSYVQSFSDCSNKILLQKSICGYFCDCFWMLLLFITKGFFTKDAGKRYCSFGVEWWLLLIKRTAKFCRLWRKRRKLQNKNLIKYIIIIMIILNKKNNLLVHIANPICNFWQMKNTSWLRWLMNLKTFQLTSRSVFVLVWFLYILISGLSALARHNSS